ncbi:polyprenol monophosphomannose synthase [Patescibacteria group bacterium]|nr:polyprenol monophosphomannose synthase [Patescibacteria group bacterium]
MSDQSTAIIIPTYNEKENIEKLVGKIIGLEIAGAKIIIVDDNSPDGTGEIADKLAKKYKGKIIVLHRACKLGLGSAYKAGFKKAFSDGFDCVVTMDADLSHNPATIPAMLIKLKKCDMVIGSRYVPGGKIIGFGIDRTLLSSLAQMINRTLLNINVSDSTSGFRAYRTESLKKIKPFEIKSEGYSYLIEAAYKLQNKGFSIGEVPIVFTVRRLGKSKISQMEIFKALKTVVRLRLELGIGSM